MLDGRGRRPGLETRRTDLQSRAMIKRQLGSTDYRISVVGLGLFAAGGWMWGEQQDDDSIAAIHAAIDAGVNWIDTAPIYGSGRADAVLAKALAQLPAERRPLVFTKFGHHLVDGQRINDGSRERVIADCEYNLRSLGVETLDLFQLHWPAPQPVEETARACEDLLKAGKIRAIGVSNYRVEHLDAWLATKVPLHCVQNGYSLIKPEAAEAELPWVADHGVGFIAHSPLHRGLLSGTWTADKTFPPGDHRGERPDFRGERLKRFVAAIDEIHTVGADEELSVPQLAIGYLLCTEGLTGCIVGARTAAQGAALGDLCRPITAKQMAAIDDILERCRADLRVIGDG